MPGKPKGEQLSGWLKRVENITGTVDGLGKDMFQPAFSNVDSLLASNFDQPWQNKQT
jgi:hypothetical protein